MDKYIVGIDIGGTKCAIILGQTVGEKTVEDFRILSRICFPTEAHKGPDQVIDRMIASVHTILQKHDISKDNLIGIGISCGGPLDHKRGIVKNPPNLYGWNDIPIVKIFEDEFNVRTRLQNDANACAAAEWKFGAARGYQNVVFLTYGTGMGAGLILDGRLYSGADDMAGEVGHVRLVDSGPVGYGKAGSFEGFCSGDGIAQLARIKVLEQLQMGQSPSFCPDLEHLSELTAKTVAEAAKDGDPLAKEIYRISGYYLGRALSIMIDILNPEIIVLGSIYERSGELLAPAMYEEIEREALEISRKGCQIVQAKLGDRIGDYAALSVAILES